MRTILDNVSFSDGMEFVYADPKEISEYLNALERERMEADPCDLRLRSDGRTLILQLTNGKVKEYQVRRSFVYKLLRWYGFPLKQLKRLSAETIANICNDYLLNIRSRVILKLENGMALSLFSPRYNEITDLEVISQCRSLGIASVSRNDFFMRLYTEEKFNTEPVKGDRCGFGLNVINSETGFRALSVCHYMLRYICSNGAVISISEGEERKYHYGRSSGELEWYLERQILLAAEKRSELAGQVEKLTEEKAGKILKVIKQRLSQILGPEGMRQIMTGITEESAQYTLFNSITDFAKYQDISLRLALETIAGGLLES